MVPNVAVVLTNGISNAETAEVVGSAERLRNSGTKVLSVGIGSKGNPAAVDGIPNQPVALNRFRVGGFYELPDVANKVFNRIYAGGYTCPSLY